MRASLAASCRQHLRQLLSQSDRPRAISENGANGGGPVLTDRSDLLRFSKSVHACSSPWGCKHVTQR
ncbi:hypothetical protein BaRGS_00036324 [Batillaria attramentaria]|uniref:Uncharacterized protein n=1 Tax=Batillaria attramentaria TaxID=370345 RepID=A0ABD0JC22_9CAEN